MHLKRTNTYTTRNVAIIAICTSLVLALKYAFGFVPGIECVTLLMIVFATFMPLFISMSICTSSILLMGAIYGMASWWVMYWFIFPTEVILTWLLKKYIGKNNIIFAVWTGFWGFSIIFWYALHDIVMFGREYAIASMSTAIITNTIEGVGNFILALVCFYPFQNMFKYQYQDKVRQYW